MGAMVYLHQNVTETLCVLGICRACNDLHAIHLEDFVSNPNWVIGGFAPREADICDCDEAFRILLELEGDARNSGSRRASAQEI
jgi:hypothetical protein